MWFTRKFCSRWLKKVWCGGCNLWSAYIWHVRVRSDVAKASSIHQIVSAIPMGIRIPLCSTIFAVVEWIQIWRLLDPRDSNSLIFPTFSLPAEIQSDNEVFGHSSYPTAQARYDCLRCTHASVPTPPPWSGWLWRSSPFHICKICLGRTFV